jgi:hypothetical protein
LIAVNQWKLVVHKRIVDEGPDGMQRQLPPLRICSILVYATDTSLF